VGNLGKEEEVKMAKGLRTFDVEIIDTVHKISPAEAKALGFKFAPNITMSKTIHRGKEKGKYPKQALAKFAKKFPNLNLAEKRTPTSKHGRYVLMWSERKG
jgi:hypothetical protein